MRIPRILAHFRQFVFAVLVTALTFLSHAFGDTFLYNSTPIESKFYVTTTSNVAGRTVKLYIKATGTFYIDWGDGNVTPHTTNSSSAAISHSYASGTCSNGCTIRFGWLSEPTAYPTGTGTTYSVSTISFYNAASDGLNKYITSVGGSLGALFPTLSGASSLTGNAIFEKQPRFISTFQGSTNLTGTIPSGLFSGLSGPFSENMFRQTFYQCSGLTGYIPDDLFDGLEIKSGTNTVGNVMYRTFYGATGMAQTCPAGTYNSASYNAYGSNWKVSTSNTPKVVSCSLCPANTYNTSTGATSLSACNACPTGTESPAGSDSVTDCVFICPADAMVNGANDGCVCNDSTNYTWNSTSNTCVFKCPADATVNGTNDGCICNNSVYSWNSSTNACVFNCPADATVNGANDGCVCNDSTNYTWNSTSNTCVFNCPADATVNGTNDGCICNDANAGYAGGACSCNTGYTWDSGTNTCVSNSCDITNHWIPDPNNLNNCICVTGYTDISGVCTPTSYTITYNTNGGTLSGTYPTNYTIESNTITLPDDTNITRSGYTFDGWYDNAGLTGTAVTSIATGSTGNKVYYASWTANTYNVTYTCDGTPTQTEQATYGTGYTGLDSANVCSEPTGYTLSSFSCNNGVTLPVNNWNIDSAVTCAATTTPKQYTVTYECGGTPTQQDTVTYGVNYTGRVSDGVNGVCTASLPTGYTLDSFVCTNNTTSNLETIPTTATPWGIDSGVTCSAVFIPKTYNVTYKCGGVTATVDSQYQTATYGASYALADSTTVCATTGYTPDLSFVCTDSGNNVVSLPTNDWNIDSAVTCSAALSPKQYTVSYTCDGVTTQTEQATYGTSYTGLDSANVCSEPTGYTLSSFSCSNGVTLPVSDWNTDSAVTCSATTSPKQYTVTYTCDGVTAQEDTATYGVSYSVRDSATVCAVQGYTPSAFVCTTNISSGVWNTDADVTCSATRTANTIALIWANGGHGTAPAIPASCIYGSTFNMPAALTDTGRTFDKWNVNGNQFNANAQSVDCNYMTLGVDSGSATITASWTLVPYNITYYNTTGASFVTPNPSTYTIEDTVALVNPTKTGYTFNGWCPGSATCNNPSMNVSFSAETGNKEYYAKWTPNTITINWNNGGHGGTPIGGSASCVYGTTFTTPIALSETGWIFNSWDGLFAAQQYDCDTGYLGTITNNSVTITANWRAESICQGDTIELDSGIVLPTNVTSNKKAMAFFNLSEYGGKTASVRGLTTINSNITANSLKDSSLIRGRWKALSVYPNTNTIWMYEGSALCSSTNLSGTSGYSYSNGNQESLNSKWPAIGVPSTTSGNNCWCKVDKFVSDMSDQASTTTNVYAWLQVYPASAMVVNDSCIDNCAEACAELFANWRDLTPHTSGNDFITALSTAVGDNVCVYDCPEGTVSNLANDGCETEVCTESSGVCNGCATGFTLNSVTNACDLNEYSITYNPDGGVLSGSYPTKYTVLSGTVALPTPIKSGYTFIGWHELSNLSDTAVNSFTVNSNNLSAKTFYAEWSTNTYTITYNTNDGTINTSGVVPVITTDLADSQYSQQYQVTTNTFTLTNPTKTGHAFAGWCFGVDNCITPELTVTITQGSTGNRTYYAQWLDCDSVKPDNATALVNVVNNTCTYAITCDAGYSHNTGSGYVIDNIVYTHNVVAELPSSITGCETPRINLTWNPVNADNAGSVSGVGFCDVGTQFTVPATTPSRTGYTFDGWDATVVVPTP